jgi:hypothetical protein
MMAINYLKLVIHRAEDASLMSEVNIAEVVVGGQDLFESLEQAIDGLRDEGWRVDDLEEFHLGVSPTGASEQGLYDLYCRAKTHGKMQYRIASDAALQPSDEAALTQIIE